MLYKCFHASNRNVMVNDDKASFDVDVDANVDVEENTESYAHVTN